MIFGRSRFRALVASQLDLFERENTDLLVHAEDLLERQNRAERDEAEETFGDYQDVYAVIGERLEEMRDAYARTLDDPDEYVALFNRSVRRRMRVIAHDFEDD